MSAVRVVTCDVCQVEEPNPAGWFTVREGNYNGNPTVMIERDRERMKGDPPGLEHACSLACLSEAMKRAVMQWARKKNPHEKK